MSYLFNYQLSLTVTSDDNVIATNNVFTQTNKVADYVYTSVILVPALSEVEIQLPGTNKILAVSISSTKLFDVSFTVDNTSQPIYTGLFGHSYGRYFTEGALLENLSIKASTEDAEVKLSVASLKTL
jgi:hypothetical protein